MSRSYRSKPRKKPMSELLKTKRDKHKLRKRHKDYERKCLQDPEYFEAVECPILRQIRTITVDDFD